MSERTFIVEGYRLRPPLSAMDYTHEAIVTIGAEKQYFYGYSVAEVLSKIVTEQIKEQQS